MLSWDWSLECKIGIFLYSFSPLCHAFQLQASIASLCFFISTFFLDLNESIDISSSRWWRFYGIPRWFLYFNDNNHFQNKNNTRHPTIHMMKQTKWYFRAKNQKNNEWNPIKQLREYEKWFLTLPFRKKFLKRFMTDCIIKANTNVEWNSCQWWSGLGRKKYTQNIVCLLR